MNYQETNHLTPLLSHPLDSEKNLHLPLSFIGLRVHCRLREAVSSSRANLLCPSPLPVKSHIQTAAMKIVFLFVLSLLLGGLALALWRAPLSYFVPSSSDTDLKVFAKFSLLVVIAFLSIVCLFGAISSMASG
ncbi:MAG: hypothetical protein EOP84_12720 [Verrucomicrobiaceae bacterium]|nr:MAG: hypothetical protein EOP84_12720 [Verrucomicrobiaceae bacterium]